MRFPLVGKIAASLDEIKQSATSRAPAESLSLRLPDLGLDHGTLPRRGESGARKGGKAGPGGATAPFPVEKAALITLFLLLLVAKLLATFHFRIDSDEPQHLHVVWSWLHVGVGYRDFFDNHTPLFHFLCVPLLYALGEHAGTLLWLRLTSLAGFAGCLFLAQRLVATFTPPRTATWAALLLGCTPPFFLTSTEFRPDTLWTLFWLAALVLLLRGQGRLSRVSCASLFLGLAFCTSMKSVLMLIALLVPALVLLLAGRVHTPVLSRRRTGAMVLCAGASLVCCPGLLAGYLWSHHALVDAYYCVIQHNLLPGSHSPAKLAQGAVCWIALMAVPVAFAVRDWRRSGHRVENRRLVFVYLVAVTFYITMRCFWHFLTAEDYLPWWALAVPLAVAGLCRLFSREGRSARSSALLLQAGCAAGLLTLSSAQGKIFQDATGLKLGLVADALRLTRPDMDVMDTKGELIFRPRASWLVLEHLTILRVKAGLLPDDIADQLVAKHVCVVSDRRLTPKAQAFTNAHYVSVAWRLKVLGHPLQPVRNGPEITYPFEIVIPETYAFVNPHGLVGGELDGQPLRGPVFLRPGGHVFRCHGQVGPLAYEWFHALECGFSPFTDLPSQAKCPGD
jgi:4-amino-4-deoxy-L-arabinose transferase-like glycosyltransferase